MQRGDSTTGLGFGLGGIGANSNSGSGTGDNRMAIKTDLGANL